MADFEIGDLAWAKMKGFTPWPAKIVAPDVLVKQPKSKEKMYYVYFFGSDNYSWITKSNIFAYEENKVEFCKKNATTAFKAAVRDILNYAESYPQKKRPSDSKPTQSTPKTNGVPTPKKSIQMNHNRMSLSKEKLPKNVKRKMDKDGSAARAKSAKKHRSSSGSSSAGSLSSKKHNLNKYPSLDTPPNSAESSSSYAWRSSYSNVTKASGLLTRPSVDRPETPVLDLSCVSDILVRKNITATTKKIGFLGLGIMGRGIVKNLLHSSHKVTVWNRSPDKCTDFVKLGAVHGHTPMDVVAASDITFSCIADPQAAKELVFCVCGVLKSMETGKGYVEMTSIDPDTSMDISEAITAKSGKYLEAPVLGSKKPAEDGTLIILASGDKDLFNDCRSCFQAMGERVFYLGDVGKASKMNLVINMVMGSTYSVLAEAMVLAERTGISQKDVLEILELGLLRCPAIVEAGKAIVDSSFNTIKMPLQHMQTNLYLALAIANQCDQTLPITSAANEVFKHAKSLGYGLHDVSAVYMRSRF